MSGTCLCNRRGSERWQSRCSRTPREILLSVTDRDFAEEFSRCLAKLLHRALPYKVRWSEKRKRCIVQGASIFLYKFLSHRWLELKPWIEHCNKCTVCYLRAFFDGEGCISRRQLTISNTNVELLLYARELLRKFGVESTGPYLGKLAGTVLKDSQTGKLYKRKKELLLFIRECSKSSAICGAYWVHD